MIADHDPYSHDDASQDHYADIEAPFLRRGRRRRGKSKALRAVLGLAAIIVTFALVVAGVGFSYLGSGPISLESWQPAIAASLQSRLKPGYVVALGPTSIQRGPHGVGIGFSGLAIRDPQGRTVVNAPGGRIGLDAFALLAMSVKVRSLELDGIQLSLRVGPNGELSLAAGTDEATPIPMGPAPAATGAAKVGAIVAGLAKAMTDEDQPLNHVAIVDGKLTVQNAGRDAPTVYDKLHLTFDRSGDSAVAGLAALGPSGEWSLQARAQGGERRQLSLEAKELAVDDLLRLDPHPPQFTFDSPVSFELAMQATPAGALQKFDGAFSLGAGKFDPHDPDGAPATAIDEATGKVNFDAEGRFALEKIEVLAGAAHVRFAGVVTPPRAADPLWRAQLHSSDILFLGQRQSDPPAKLDKVDLDAHFDRATMTLETDKLTLAGPNLKGDFHAKVHMAAAGPELALDLNGTGSLTEALSLWPTFINPDARKWCVENIRAGELATGSLKINWDASAFAEVLAKRAPPAESVNGHFTLRDAKVDLLPGLPTTTGLDATGEITGRYFHVSAQHGTMDLGDGHSLSGNDLSYTVPDTTPVARMPAQGSGHIVGGADSLAALLSQDALKKYVGVTLDPSTIKGQFQGDLKLDLTMGKGVQPEEQKFRVTGALSNLSIDKFLGPAKLEQGALDVVADRSQLKMSGTGQLFGSKAQLDVAKVGQDVGALTVTAVLDETARSKLGFNSGPKIKGPITLKLKAPLDKTGADLDVDLTKAALDSIGGPPWKAAGRGGKATFQLKAAPDGVVQVNNIVVDAGSLSARGGATFGADGALKSLKLAPFKMSAGDDLKLDLDISGNASKLTLRGSSLDARGFVKGVTGGGSNEKDNRDLDLDIKVASATGYNKEDISNFEMTGARRNGAFTTMQARGKLGRASFTARSGADGAILVKSDDAGSLSRFLDIYSKMEGGTIELTVKANGDSAKGSATIQRFTIRDEPSLKQLAQSAPPPQSPQRGVSSAPGGDASTAVRFDKLSATFIRSGGKLEVTNGAVANPSFGLTTKGFIDFAKDNMDLNGVFVPLYGVNNALGAIPVLGTLLTGGENEGVFAVNYRVTGPASNPTLNINPLSPLTPGILRKMFGAIDGTTPFASPGDSPASSYAPTVPSR